MAVISNKKNYGLTLLSSFGGHLSTLVLNLVSVPISLNYWGREKYGLFAIINSVIVYLSISNLGLNSAASILMAKNSRFRDKIAILRRSFYMLLGSILAFSLSLYMVNRFTSRWVYLLGDIPDSLFSETYGAMLLMVVFFFINAVFSHIDAVFNGFQRLYVQKVFDTLFLFLSFGVLLLTVAVKGSLWHFVLFNGLARLLVSLIKIAFFYYRIYGEEKRRGKAAAFSGPEESNTEVSYRAIITTGLKMVVIGIAAMVVWHTDNMVISHYLGIDKVTPYSVSFRIYSAFFSLIAVLNGAILPLIARELSLGNWEWINRVYGILVKLMALVGGMFWLCGVLFLKDFIIFWAGPDGFAGLAVIIALGGYSYLLSMVNLNAGVAISMNYVDEVVWVGWIEAAVKLISSIMLLHYWGLAGVAAGTFLGSFAGPMIFLPWVIKRRSGNRIDFDAVFVARHFFLVLLPSLLVALLIQANLLALVPKILISVVLLLIYLLASKKMLPHEVIQYIMTLIPAKYRK